MKDNFRPLSRNVLLMIHCSPFQKFFLVALLCVAAVSPVMANDSLFRPESAMKFSMKWGVNFGPSAKKFRYDARMVRAAQIAEGRAHAHSTRQCWRYVKRALVDAQAVSSYPTSAYAKQAGPDLVAQGFKKVAISDPYLAPVGAVLVYGGRGAGHVEIRTTGGFVSDFDSPKPSSRPLIGVYLKNS